MIFPENYHLSRKKCKKISLSLSPFLLDSVNLPLFSDMSILKGIIDSLGSIFSSPYESHPNPSSPNSSSTMEGGAGPSVSNERVAYKLKGFFDLAKEEIAKAVRAEEWGLVDDSIVHYKNAQRVLIEASSTSAPSFISSR
jgi:spastin